MDKKRVLLLTILLVVYLSGFVVMYYYRELGLVITVLSAILASIVAVYPEKKEEAIKND